MALEGVDRLVALLPEALVARAGRQLLALEPLRVDAHGDDLLVVGAVEDRDASARREGLGRAPQEVVAEFLVEGCLNETTSTPVGFTPDITWHRPVLAGGIHRLEHDQQPVAPAGPEQLVSASSAATLRAIAVWACALSSSREKWANSRPPIPTPGRGGPAPPPRPASPAALPASPWRDPSGRPGRVGALPAAVLAGLGAIPRTPPCCTSCASGSSNGRRTPSDSRDRRRSSADPMTPSTATHSMIEQSSASAGSSPPAAATRCGAPSASNPTRRSACAEETLSDRSTRASIAPASRCSSSARSASRTERAIEVPVVERLARADQLSRPQPSREGGEDPPSRSSRSAISTVLMNSRTSLSRPGVARRGLGGSGGMWLPSNPHRIAHAQTCNSS